MSIETTAKCPYCEANVTVEIDAAANNEKMFDLVANCPECNWIGNSFIELGAMLVIQEPTA